MALGFEVLKLPFNKDNNRIFPYIRDISMSRRKESVDEAISFKPGKNQEERVFTDLYSENKFRISVGKPGKEAAEGYNGSRGVNKNDMSPTLFVNNKPSENRFSFDGIFEMLYEVSKINIGALEVIGCILFRAAYMLDHEKINGKWRLVIPKEVILSIEKNTPVIRNIPIKVFIFMLEIIALQEDVKYYTLGMNDDLKDGTGRRNNLLTYCMLIGVLLERQSFAKFCGSFARPPVGISTLTQKTTLETFPALNPFEE